MLVETRETIESPAFSLRKERGVMLTKTRAIEEKLTPSETGVSVV